MTDEITYTNRNGIFSSETTYVLSGTDIAWTNETGSGRIPFSKMQKLQMIHYVSQSGLAWQCKLSSVDGEKLIIRSEHYAGFGDGVDHSSTFRPFVETLIATLSEKNPDAKLILGSNIFWLIWNVLFAIFCVITLLLVLAVLGGADYGVAGVAVLTGLFVRFLWPYIKAGGAKTLDPKSPFDWEAGRDDG